MPTIQLPSGKTFVANINETILDAALRANVILEHSCKTGRCGACKAHVISGASTALLDEVALMPTELSAGFILSCARAAVTDVVLDVEDLGNITLFPVKTLPCRVHALERLSDDVLCVRLRLPPNQAFDYLPGQYLDVIGQNGLRRSYSVANADLTDKQIELHIRQVANGEMSNYWFNTVQLNDLLRLNGPLGTFFLRDVFDVDLILLATGTGMAPIKAILERLAKSSPEQMPRSIRVYWGGRVVSDFYWNPEIVGLSMSFTPVLSRKDATWSGSYGYVQQAVLQSGVSLNNAVVYACGSIDMIDSARTELVAAGLSRRRFYADAFVSSSHGFKE